MSLCSAAIFFVFLLAFPGFLPAQAADEGQVEQLHAEAQRAEAAGDVATAIAKYEAILQIAPKLSVAYNNLGALYFRAGEYGKAANVLERGLKLNPTMTTATALLGISLYKMEKYAEARKPLEAATRANPQDVNAATFLAEDLTKLGDLTGAAAALQQLTRRQPKNQQAWYMLAQVYMRLSEQSLAKMTAINPNSPLSHALSAEVMEGMNNYEGAVAELKKAVDMAPEEPGMHYKLGDAYWNLEQWDRAAEQFKAELQNDPHNCRAHWKLGDIALQQNGDPQQALTEENEALQVCPTLTGAELDRGRALLKLRHSEEALADFKKAETAEPNNPQIHYLLAQAFRSLGQMPEAKAEMELFSKLGQQQRAATAQQAQEVVNAGGARK